MYEEIDLPLNWPAEVNYHEAKAFCHWLGPKYRLATEAEHNVMRGQLPSVNKGIVSDPAYHKDWAMNLHFKYGSSTVSYM